MSAAALQAVLASDIQPVGVRMVAVALAWHANPDSGLAWPSNATIASEAGVTRDHVRASLRRLVRTSVVEVVSTGTGGAHSGTTRYRFVDAWMRRHARDSAHPGSYEPGCEATAHRGSSEPAPGFERTPNRNERKAKPSLSLKERRHGASDAPRGRAAALGAIPTTHFDAQARARAYDVPLEDV